LSPLAFLPSISPDEDGEEPHAEALSKEEKAKIVRHNARMWRRRIIVKLQYLKYRNKCMKLFFWVLLLAYVSVRSARARARTTH